MHREEGTKTCSFCGLHLESIQHALWNCMAVCSVWKRMLRLIDVAYGPNVITWGNVFWMDVNVDKHNYETEKILFALQTRGRQVKDTPYSTSNWLNVDATVWAMVYFIFIFIFLNTLVHKGTSLCNGKRTMNCSRIDTSPY